MPSFQDSAFIILLGLLLFGPKGLAKIARQVGKLVGEFRRASSDFRMQMEDELRMAEQTEKQEKIAAIEAAAPVAPLLHADLPEPEHPHTRVPPAAFETTLAEASAVGEHHIHEAAAVVQPAAPLPIASHGDLHLMPPATGLPMARSSSSATPSATPSATSSVQSSASSSSALAPVFDAIPHANDPALTHEHAEATHG